MNIPQSMLCTLAVFVIAWLLYLAPQFRGGLDLERFEYGKRGSAEAERAAEAFPPTDMPAEMQIVRMPAQPPQPVEPPEIVPVASKPPAAPVPQPVAAPQPMPPMVAAQPPTTRPAVAEPPQTYGFDIKQFDLLFDGDIKDEDAFFAMLRQAGCEVVVIKSRKGIAESAFLPGSGRALIERLSGPLASEKFDHYRRQHPLARHFWILWHDGPNPIARRVKQTLEEQQLLAWEYRTYLVMSERMSHDIQLKLRQEAERRQLTPAEVVYAQIVLRPVAGKFYPEVLRLEGEYRAPAPATGPSLSVPLNAPPLIPVESSAVGAP